MPVRSLSILVREGLPRVGDGKTARYPWPDIWHWYYKRERQKAKDEARPKDRNEAEERLAIAKAQMAELELDEARKVLARKADVLTAWRTMAERILGRLRALPAKASPALVGLKKPAEGQVILEWHIEEAIGEIRDYEGAA